MDNTAMDDRESQSESPGPQSENGDNTELSGANVGFEGAPPETVLPSLEAAIMFGTTWGVQNGVDLVRRYPGDIRYQNPDKVYFKYPWECSRHLSRKVHKERPPSGRKDGRPKAMSKRCGCPMRVVLEAVDHDKPEGAWKIRHCNRNMHNHAPDDPKALSGLRRRTQGEDLKQFMIRQHESGIKPREIYDGIVRSRPDVIIDMKDVYNVVMKETIVDGVRVPKPRVPRQPKGPPKLPPKKRVPKPPAPPGPPLRPPLAKPKRVYANGPNGTGREPPVVDLTPVAPNLETPVRPIALGVSMPTPQSAPTDPEQMGAYLERQSRIMQDHLAKQQETFMKHSQQMQEQFLRQQEVLQSQITSLTAQVIQQQRYQPLTSGQNQQQHAVDTQHFHPIQQPVHQFQSVNGGSMGFGDEGIREYAPARNSYGYSSGHRA